MSNVGLTDPETIDIYHDNISEDIPARTMSNGSSCVADEMMEITPEVHDFFGNHFMAADEGEEKLQLSPNVVSEDFGESEGYLCRLCGRSTPSPASLFSHLLYPHYAHLWRDEIPQRKQKYDCVDCDYNTKNRQRFLMHVARVHDDLKRKLTALGENLEVLANTSYTTRCKNPATTRIVSKVAKMRHSGEMEDNSDVSESFSTPKIVSCTGSTYNDPVPAVSPKQVRCRVCGNWKRRENFFTHMVSVHFRHLWENDIERSAPMYYCEVEDCSYSTKYRYNLLFHLGGRHKQLREKLQAEGISDLVLEPMEPDDPDQATFEPKKVSAFKTGVKKSGIQRNIKRTAAFHPSQIRHRSVDVSKRAVKKLQCKVCGKIAHNHASHRLHVVSRHFGQFWSNLEPDDHGTYVCRYPQCEYRSSNRQVFIIHVAFVHSELKLKLEKNGQNPTLGEPLGKRNSILMPRQKLSITISRKRDPVSSKEELIVKETYDKSCRFCNKDFESQNAMMGHVALTHFSHLWDGDVGTDENPYAVKRRGPFDCSQCDRKFDDRETYILHLVFQHDVLYAILGEDYVATKGEDEEL